MKKSTLELLLYESDLSNLAFTIVERFSTHEKLNNILSSVFSLIGNSLRMWSNSDFVNHIFINESLVQCHRLICNNDDKQSNNYKDFLLKPPKPSFNPFSSNNNIIVKTKELPKDKDDVLLQVSLENDILDSYNGSIWITSIDFSNGFPLGFFSIIWKNDPKLSEETLNLLQSVLWSLSKTIALMLGNHFPIHKTTYLPSYCPEEEKETAILFADIRNSTPLFEIARLGGTNHIRKVEILLKTWLEYAANLISSNGLGHIHHFSGDGILATFGEYAVDSKFCKKDILSCILALHTAKHLYISFHELYKSWLKHSNVNLFYLENNEDVDVTLGIGINYGKVLFGYYGTACNPNFSKQIGHLEYNLIGDHVNTAERLESIASKLEKEVDIFYRGEKHKDKFRISPIILSQTVSKRFSQIFKEDENNLNKRRGIVHLKGKGIALPFFETEINDIDNSQLTYFLKEEHNNHYRECLNNPPDLYEYINKMISKL
jgi:class 3 adenylate cyclase